jgi:hypothetical protein
MYGLSQDEWTNLVLSVNTHRGQRRLSPAEVAALLARAIQQATAEQVASSLGFRGADMVRRFLLLNCIPPDLREMVDWGARPGAVSLSTATALAGLAEPAVVAAAFRAAIEHSFSKSEAIQLKQAYLRGRGAVADCVASVLQTRPRVERRELTMGAITAPDVASRIGELTPEQRAQSLKAAAASAFPGVRMLGSSLGKGRFSFLLDEANARLLRDITGGRSLEDTVTRAVGDILEVGG